MKKLFISFLSVLCLITLGAGLSACAGNKTEVDKLAEQGYLISVKYDASGGKFLNQTGRYILDMFNPSFYKKDAEGNISVRLYDPSDSEKGRKFELTRDGYFYVGWYRKREVVRDSEKNALGEKGEKLYEDVITGEFFSDEKHKNPAIPAYKFSDRWDFDSDVLVYNCNGKKLEMTLYAAWVPYFTYTYYYKYSDELNKSDVEWKEYGKTDFDYKYNKSVDGEYDICYLPDWSETATIDGAEVKCGYMNHVHSLKNGKFTFAELEGATFKAAYTDPEMTARIDKSLKHPGTVNEENAVTTDADKKIYVVFDKGSEYRIATAKQLADTAKGNGRYQLLCDIDFSLKNKDTFIANWPQAFESGTFSGEFDGKGHKISGVTATHSSLDREYGGLFGFVSKDAKIKDVIFENATFDLRAVPKTDLNDSYFGVFAGYIEDNAKVSGVSLVNATFRIKGDLTIRKSSTIALMANNDVRGVTRQGIRVVVYGIEEYADDTAQKLYRYTISNTAKIEKTEVTIDKTKFENETIKLETCDTSLPESEFVLYSEE